ncbi:MAG TPA: SsrA-binding protein SmpB [Candidatus Fermentibacter sp.]|nr:SsrA-binding protein SmpB [Candidatus Fermentibacter sp.]
MTRNRRAFYDYEILDTVEVGLVLRGTEARSVREGGSGLAGSYASFDDRGQLWVTGMHVPEYDQARENHPPNRRRKLLAHRRELDKLRRRIEEKGLTLVPLDLHYSNGIVKMLLGVCRGRREHDRREEIARRDDRRRIEAAMKVRRD